MTKSLSNTCCRKAVLSITRRNSRNKAVFVSRIAFFTKRQYVYLKPRYVQYDGVFHLYTFCTDRYNNWHKMYTISIFFISSPRKYLSYERHISHYQDLYGAPRD